MSLTFKRISRSKGLWLSIGKAGMHKPFTQGLCFDLAHSQAIEKRFNAWASMGWPYIVKGE